MRYLLYKRCFLFDETFFEGIVLTITEKKRLFSCMKNIKEKMYVELIGKMNLYKYFILHEWYSISRNSKKGIKKIEENVSISFTVGIYLVTFLVFYMSIFLVKTKIQVNIQAEKLIFASFFGLMLFLTIIRLIFFEVIYLDITKYFTFQIKKIYLANYLIHKSLFSIFNLVALIGSFFFSSSFYSFTTLVLMIYVINNYFFLVKMLFFWDIITLSFLSIYFFVSLFLMYKIYDLKPYLLLLMLLIGISLFFINRNLLMKRFYQIISNK